ncbi:serine/threonine-protein kinase PknK [Chondromyces crocatus]|uniref:Protein kinase n=1 Tax=Chondromyces crocatus TaxID=52 RepID=A0A0K1E8J7_CHOCO|nr:serine/threonine-protein kinase [Chondromyces crocatus]AKT37180.1 protein kinase [Chondromyces crocatus]
MADERSSWIPERFRIERLVARGGMGSVYRAFDRELQRFVALKLMDACLGEGMDAQRFAREVETLAHLEHPRVVQFLGQGQTEEGRPFLVMQWLDGEDLRSRLTRGPLSLRDALEVLKGATEALSAVHALGIVHRDLKPANLFLPGGSIADLTLIDFGIARRITSAMQLTLSGMILGTPQYMAPEQAGSSRSILAASDVYSLGVIFYECLAGKPPFDGPHFAGVLARVLFEAEVPIRALRPSIPDSWAELIGQMLSKTPALRPKDAITLRMRLSRLPAASDDIDGDATAAWSTSPSSLAAGEQTLVCVVLIIPLRHTVAELQVPESERSSHLTAELFARRDTVRSGLSRFGFVTEVLADGSLIATLSSSNVATDLARIAARGALYAREAWPEARIALATGRLLLGHHTCVGEAVDRAACLLSATHDRGPGGVGAESGIWIDQLTAGLLDERFVMSKEAGGVLLRGEQQAPDQSRLLLGKPTPCVGREVELAQLEGLMARAVEDDVAQAALVLAPPGAGKSRLRHELLRRVQRTYPEAVILSGQGDPLTAGSPYGLLSNALRQHAGICAGDPWEQSRALLTERIGRHLPPAEVQRVIEFLGELCGVLFPADGSLALRAARSDPRYMSEQIVQAFLDWLVAEASLHPIVLVLEDLQWGDALTVKLIDSVLRDGDHIPLLVLALGRPEVKDAFPVLFAEHAQEVVLRPLSRRASEALIRGVLGDAVTPSVLGRLTELAGGNALFLEELIRSAAEGKAGKAPETVLAMLQARIAHLTPDARRVLRAASIFGEAFWAEPIQRLCDVWGGPEDVTPWLAHLVEAEFVQRRRHSRFPTHAEYAFRHALVRDAAYSLLTSSDRQSGHLFAGRWLEAMGDTDDIELAGHAWAGGEQERALTFYTHAAEQSLGQNDQHQAIAHAAKGLACGAEGHARGVLSSIQSIALYKLGEWARCSETGLEALDLLPRGSLWWCRTAERLLHVLAQLDRIDRANLLTDEILATTPETDARAAYVYALCTLIGSLTLVGARGKAESCIALLEKNGHTLFDTDLRARGMALCWHSYFLAVLGAEPWRACVLAEESARVFAEGKVPYQLALAGALVGFMRLELGDLEGAEQSGRSALAGAEQLGDGYMLVNARFYLAHTLSERSEPALLDEAVALAQRVLDAEISASYDGCAHWIFAEVALAREQWPVAEVEARPTHALFETLPSYRVALSRCLLRSLIGQGRVEEAANIAREDLERIDRLGGGGFAEILFRAAAAEALLLAGDVDRARDTLGHAVRELERCASSIPDALAKERYLRRNQAVQQLVERWPSDAGPPP